MTARDDALDRITRFEKSIDNFNKDLAEIRSRVKFLESKHPLYMYEEDKGWQVAPPVGATPRVDKASFIPNYKPILENARALIERGWTQCELAIDPSGVSCDPCDPSAFAWTILGALCEGNRAYLGCSRFAIFGFPIYVIQALENTAIIGGNMFRYLNPLPKKPGILLHKWNSDKERKKSDVLSLFDSAIENCEVERFS